MAVDSAMDQLRDGQNTKTGRASLFWRRLWRHRALYIMLLPAAAWYLVYQYLPMYGLTIAFKDFKILKGILASPWADPWYKHFAILLRSPYFPVLIRNTVIISLYKIVGGTVASLLIALILNECHTTWYKRLIQTLNYAPFFLSWVVVYGIFLALFSEQTGLVSRWIEALGGQPVSLLQSRTWFRLVLLATHVWKTAGYGAVVYLAALSGVDPELYEAAVVDGANRLQLIRHISLPAIRGVIILMVILSLGGLLQAGFEQVYIFYNVRVYEVADIISTWVYRTGLEQLNFSLSVAVGMFQSVIGFFLVLMANRLARHWGESIW